MFVLVAFGSADPDIVRLVASVHEAVLQCTYGSDKGFLYRVETKDAARSLRRGFNKLKGVTAAWGIRFSIMCPNCCRLTPLDADMLCLFCAKTTELHFPDYVRSFRNNWI